MSKRADKEILNDIKEAAGRINAYIGKMSYDEFLKNAMVQDAIVRNFEIIGEGAKNVSAALKRKHPEAPWKELAGLRDRLIHQYFGVNYDIVWTIVKEELPEISARIEGIR